MKMLIFIKFKNFLTITDITDEKFWRFESEAEFSKTSKRAVTLVKPMEWIHVNLFT